MEEGGLYYPEIDTEQKLNEKITRNPGSILVAELKGEMIGNVLIMEDGWGPFFFKLAVAKDYRGKGVGSRLLEEVEYLPQKGITKCIALLRIATLS